VICACGPDAKAADNDGKESIMNTPVVLTFVFVLALPAALP
jgi:hypothetical protein